MFKGMVFPVVMYGYECCTIKKSEHEELMFLTCGAGSTLESPLDCKEIQPVHCEDQPRDFFGRNDAKAETPGLWPPHVKS